MEAELGKNTKDLGLGQSLSKLNTLDSSLVFFAAGGQGYCRGEGVVGLM